jgi:hypothetical protein
MPGRGVAERLIPLNNSLKFVVVSSGTPITAYASLATYKRNNFSRAVFRCVLRR